MGEGVLLSRAAKTCAFFGLSQISSLSPNSEFHIVRWRVIYSKILWCLLVLLMVPIQTRVCINDFATDDDIAGNVILAYWSIMYSMLIFLAVGSSILNRKALLKVVNTFRDLQNSLVWLPGGSKNVLAGRHTAILATFLFCMEVADILVTNYYLENIAETIATVYLFFTIFQFDIHVLVAYSLLHDLNKELSTYLKNLMEYQNAVQLPRSVEFLFKTEENGKTAHGTTSTTEAVRTIQRYRSLYMDICAGCEDLNDIFGPTNVLLTAELTFALILGGYFTIGDIKAFDTSSWESIIDLVTSIRWCSTALVPLCLFIYPCTKVTTQNSQITNTVHCYLNLVRQPEVSQELSKFSIILHKTLEFSPYSLFTLNNSLILTIVSSSVSYLVLVSQLPKTTETPTTDEIKIPTK